MRKPCINGLGRHYPLDNTQSIVHMTHVDWHVELFCIFTAKSNKEAWSSGWSFNSLGLNVLVGFVDWQTLFSYQIGKVYSGAKAGTLLLI